MKMAPRDAQTWWLSTLVPSDQFLVYSFDNTDVTSASVASAIIDRARRLPPLSTCLMPGWRNLAYPRWVPRTVTLDDIGYAAFNDEADLVKWLEERIGNPSHAVDVTRCPWRITIVKVGAASRVLVLQISHAAADGELASSVVRQLLSSDNHHVSAASHAADRVIASAGRPTSRPLAAALMMVEAMMLPVSVVRTTMVGRSAARLASKSKAAPSASEGERATGFTPAVINRATSLQPHLRQQSATRPTIRLIRRSKSQLLGTDTAAAKATVTAIVLAAVATALAHYLERGCLGAEVTIADARTRGGRNNFHNVGIDLRCEATTAAERLDLILRDVGRHRVPVDPHALHRAHQRVIASMPALFLAQGILRHTSYAITPECMTGNTVVSSVNRGEGNLTLGDGPVRWTTSFPGLSPFMGLTHGVHGIGDTVTISVVTIAEVMPDVDRYVSLLCEALDGHQQEPTFEGESTDGS